VLVLSEAVLGPPATRSVRDNQEITEAAKLAGCRVYYIPSNFDECETAENALWHVPEQERETPAVWIGFIPSADRYGDVYTAAAAKRIRLVNTPEEHWDGLEFDRAYPKLVGITPETVILDHPAEWPRAAEQLGFPVFLRGAVRSRKESGFSACVAHDPTELQQIVNHLFAYPYRSRGRVLVRRLARLRHTRMTENGFPIGREYRVFLYRGAVLGLGYYWDGDDPLAALTADEEAVVSGLAAEAAARVGTPFLCADIGQMEEGTWTVIEVGDAQFAGTGHTPLLPLWQRLIAAVG